MGEMISAYKLYIGKREGKRPCGRPRRRWKDIIRMGLREIGWEVVDLMQLAQNTNQWWALVNMGIY
jgi:hypothetical protein